MGNVRKTNDLMYLKYEFSDEELAQIAKDLAQSVRERTNIDNALTEIKASYKAKISKIDAVIAEASAAINSEYDFRNVPVTFHYNSPAEGMRTTTRDDTGENIEECKMTEEEMQEPLLDE